MHSSTGDDRVEVGADRAVLNTPGSCHKQDLRDELVSAAFELVAARRQLELGTRLDGARLLSPEVQRLQARARLDRLDRAWLRLTVVVNAIEYAELVGAERS